KWEAILDGRTLPVYDKPREQAWRHWAMALAHSAGRDVRAARSESAAMDAAIQDLARKTKSDTPPALLVARAELAGHLAYAAGKSDRALASLEAASRKEMALRYNEPPAYPRPAAEALGRMALEHRRLQLAETAFRRALTQYPENSRAMAGLRETLRLEG